MRAVVNREAMASALAALERVADKNSNIDVLKGVWMQADERTLRLRATDLELYAAVAVDPTETAEPGTVVVQARLIASIVRHLPGDDVALQTGNGMLVVRGSGATFQLVTADPRDFPDMPTVDGARILNVPARALGRALRRVVLATENSHERPAFGAVAVQHAGASLELVATDGKRLAHDVIPLPDGQAEGDGPDHAMIPARSAEEIIRMCERAPEAAGAMLELGARLAAAEVAGYRLVTRLVEGSMPPYRQVLLEDPPVRVAFDRVRLLGALQRMAVLSRRGPAVILFGSHDAPSKDAVRLSIVEQDVGQGEEWLDLADGEWPHGVSAAYVARQLIDALEAMDTDTVVYELSNPARQAQWTSGSYRYVVMPVRLA